MSNSPLPTSGYASNLAAGPVKIDDDRSRPPLLSLFFAFQIIGGHIGFPILLAVSFALGNASSRHPLFINFCIIWIISSVVFCMLLYAGYDTGPEPPFTICAIQASLVYAMPVMAVVSLWTIVFHLWLCLRGAMTKKAQWLCSRQRLWGLIVLPYLAAIPFVVFPALIAQMMPARISRRQTDFGFHCSTRFRPLRTTAAASIAFLLVLLLVWEALVGWICYKNWRAVREMRVHGWTSVGLFARIATFTLYVMAGIGACAVAIAFPSNRFRILFQASLPTAAFLVFGSRPNLWKRKPDNRYMPPSRATQPELSLNSRVTLSDTAPVVRQGLARFASNTSQGSGATLVQPTRSDSSSTDGDSMRQIEHASTIRSSSLQSFPPSALERGSGGTAIPALPRGQAVPNTIDLEGTTQWLPPRKVYGD